MAFMCDECDATYPVRMSLSNHKRLNHGDVLQFNCEHCVYSTTKKDHLEQHIQSVHEQIKETCETCGKNFSKKSNLNKHMKNKHSETLQKEETKRKATETLETQPKRIKITQPESNDDDDGDERDNDEGNEKTNDFKCTICDTQFKELKNLNKHMKNVHEEKSMKCNNCSYITNDVPSMQRHTESCNKRKSLQDVIEQDTNRAREEVHSDNQPPNEDIVSDDTETCFGGTLQTKIWKPRGTKDILKVLENYKSQCMRSAWYHLKKNKGIIFHITLKITLFKIKQDGEVETRAVYLRGKNRRMLDISEFEDLYDESKNKIWLTFDAWLKDGSGWIIQSIDEFHLKICKYTPLQGSSYIKSPNKI